MKQRFTYLFDRYYMAQASVEEESEFFMLIDSGEWDQLLKDLMDHAYSSEELELNDSQRDTTYRIGVEDRILNRVFSPNLPGNSSGLSNKPMGLLWRLFAAAAIITLVFATGILFWTKYQQRSSVAVLKVQDIAPGKVGATLTLSNGKKIRLDQAASGALVKEAGISITKSVNGELIYEVVAGDPGVRQLNTLSTSMGQTYRVRLSDGSMVWLNAGSSLTYHSDMIQEGKRLVKLSGEGYFEVAKDRLHPFVVESRGQAVEVLGTHFNINAYADEPVSATTLLEGSVKITSAFENFMLKPGQQAKSSEREMKISSVDMENVTDWKNGDFSLNHLEFKTAMRKIARWYNVEVIYQTDIPEDTESGGWVSRDKSLSAVLNALEATGLASFKVVGRKVYVYKQ